MQHFIQAQQLLPLAFHQPGHRDAGPAGNDFGNFLLGHFLPQQAISPLFVSQSLFLRRQPAFEFRQPPVGQLRRLLQVVVALGHFDIAANLFNLFPQRLNLLDRLFLGFPLGLHGIGLAAEFRQLFLNRLQALLARLCCAPF